MFNKANSKKDMRITTLSTCSSSSSVTTSDSWDSEFSQLPSPDDTLLPTRKDRRVLRFYPRVLMQETLHIKNYSPSEIAESWYSEDEFTQIRMDVRNILCDSKGSLKDSEYNIAMWRGLEGLTQYGSKRRNNQKMAGWLVVVQNSHLHFDQNVNEVANPLNCQRLAHAYHVATQSAVLDAIQRAQGGDDSIAQTYRKRYASQWNNNCATNRRKLLREIPKLPIRRIRRMFSRRIHCLY